MSASLSQTHSVRSRYGTATNIQRPVTMGPNIYIQIMHGKRTAINNA